MLWLRLKWIAPLACIIFAAAGCFPGGPACNEDLRIEFEPALQGLGLYEFDISAVYGERTVALALSCTLQEQARWNCLDGVGMSVLHTGDRIVSITIIAPPDEVSVVVRKDGELEREQSFAPEYSIVDDGARECKQATVTMTD